MSVAINSTRKAVEISWDPSGGVTEPPVEEKPPGFPEHPIYLPPYVDNTLPEVEGPVDPDYGVDEGAHPDQGLPTPEEPVDPGYGVEEGSGPVDPGYGVDEGTGPVRPSHPIYLPPYIDNALPGDQPYPDNTLPEVPPEGIEGVPPETIEKIKDFLFGNLPPFEGGPDYAAPVSAGVVEAVQVFAQGQDGDWSNTAVTPNDGLAALTYPKDFKGESYIEVRALDGSLVDSGTIKVS